MLVVIYFGFIMEIVQLVCICQLLYFIGYIFIQFIVLAKTFWILYYWIQLCATINPTISKNFVHNFFYMSCFTKTCFGNVTTELCGNWLWIFCILSLLDLGLCNTSSCWLCVVFLCFVLLFVSKLCVFPVSFTAPKPYYVGSGIGMLPMLH